MNLIRDLSVGYKTSLVLEKLKQARESYVVDLKRAQAGYVASVKEEMEALAILVAQAKTVEDLERAEIYRKISKHNRPSDHTELFDTAISMLEMSCDEEIRLNSQQQQAMLHGKFPEMANFRAQNEVYISKAVGL